MIDWLWLFRCPECKTLLWKREHRPVVRQLVALPGEKPYYGVGDLEYTYPCGRKEYGDSLPEFR